MGYVKRKLTSNKLDVIKKMPPLHHSLPDEKFDIFKSETINWLLQQPEILYYLWDEVARRSENVIYNQETKKWTGIEYEEGGLK
jgi:hypothetical protein